MIKNSKNFLSYTFLHAASSPSLETQTVLSLRHTRIGVAVDCLIKYSFSAEFQKIKKHKLCDSCWRIKALLKYLQPHSLNSHRSLVSKMPSLSIICRISDFPNAMESMILAIDDTLKYCHGNLADESYVAALVSAVSDLKVSGVHFLRCSVAKISLLGSSHLSW